MTIEELEVELAEAQVVIARLAKHSSALAEAIREESVACLARVRNLNTTYQNHANFMTEVEKGMKAYVERLEAAGD